MGRMTLAMQGSFSMCWPLLLLSLSPGVAGFTASMASVCIALAVAPGRVCVAMHRVTLVAVDGSTATLLFFDHFLRYNSQNFSIFLLIFFAVQVAWRQRPSFAVRSSLGPMP